jgi:amidohydrolase
MTPPHVDPEFAAQLTTLRRDLHRQPELSGQEHATAARVEAELRALGLAPERWGETAVVAVVEGSEPGQTVMLRADMDALPIQEEATHDYASERPGVMHACGHDAHMAMLVGAARLLTADPPACGRILLAFQPAEEQGAGAAPLIRAGLLDRFEVRRVFGIHVWSGHPSGRLIVTEGPAMAAVDQLAVTVEGRGGHGAQPERAVDPVVAAAAMVTSLQSVVARRLAPEDAAVLTIGALTAGDSYNVIPQRARLKGTMRSFTLAVRDRLRAELARVIQGVAAAYDVRAEIEVTGHTVPLLNDAAACRVVREVASEMPALNLDHSGWRTMAGEDMALFLAARPGAFAFLGTGGDGEGALAYPHHHPRFDLDESMLPVGAELLARVGRRLIKDSSNGESEIASG